MDFEINGVHIYSMTSYYFIVKTPEVENLTAMTNNELFSELATKIDPAMFDVLNSVTDTLNASNIG